MSGAREWLINYCNETIANTKYRCKKHRQACQRCLNLLEENHIYFDEKQAENVVKFFTYLHHSKGVLAGKPIILDGLSKFIAYNIYGFKYKETGYRVYRKAFISMGRKGQKSQLQSGFALYEMSVMATKWKTMNYCTCAGVTRKQSKVIFEECQLMLRGSKLASKFKITRDAITHLKTLSRLEALSKEAKKDGEGTNVQLAIIDEYKDHEDSMFYEIAETGQKALPQPLLIIISTAGNNISCPMRTQEYPYAERLLNGEVLNERYFTVICEVEEGDDINDYQIWQKANQLLFTYQEGIDGLIDGYNVAKEIPEKMNTFLIKNLNIWLNDSGKQAYLDMGRYDECTVDEAPINLKGRDIYIGIDGASKNDLFGVTFHIPFIRESDKKLCIYQESYGFVPDYDKILWHRDNDKMSFDYWYEKKWIMHTNNIIINAEVVMEYCFDFIKKYQFKNVYWIIDPSAARDVANYLLDRKQNVFEIYQSKKHLNDPTVGYRNLVKEGRLYALRNDCVRWQMSNAKIEIDEATDMIKIDKHKQRYRIDCVDSSIFASKLSLYWKPTTSLRDKIMSGFYG